MQFDDLNEDMTAFQRRYAPQIKRCDEMERVLGFFETQFKELDVNVPDGQKAAKNFWVRHDAELREYSGISGNRLIEMERKLLKEEKALRQLNETYDKLNNEFNACKELKYVVDPMHCRPSFSFTLDVGARHYEVEVYTVDSSHTAHDPGLPGHHPMAHVRYVSRAWLVAACTDRSTDVAEVLRQAVRRQLL